ncbi:hypothetical protein TOPH_05326 [Tolypocladium ophioglossoides CBS 100239]|uniref:Rhodopsin domain-containing protein n=1 Tax=Tolypocladium ophioglossoides (strain CBS 100239) TaxID=1163406 RepID=A0A0L0N7I4_TOLOC|nr:hypothetical protein TOPH_05326 [Tolypocladium ophioglossoides CBS 100239]
MAATSPAFAPISPDDHRGLLWIAAILSLIFVLLTLSARLYVRKHMLGRDDYASIAAVVLGVAQYAAVFTGMPLGLGTSKAWEREGNEPETGKIFLASEALFICVLYMAKFAVLLATERLLAGNMKTVRKICIMIRIVVGLAALASLLIISLGCSMGSLRMPQSHSRCNGQVWRWTAVSIVDGVTELCILGVFYSIIWSLQMRRKLKMTLTILLGLRIICPVFTGIHTSAVSSFISSSDPAVRVISPLVWQQIALGYSLISALLIALMPFLKSFHTGMGVDVRNLTNVGSSGSGRGGGRQYSYRLEQLSKHSKHSNTATTLPAEDEEALASAVWSSAQPRQVIPKSKLEAELADTPVPGQMVIQKTTNWSVRYDDSHQ